jgi:hypothetical protein
VPLQRGCLVVGPGIAGVKVYLVQKALGLVGHREVYDAATRSLVSAFQRAHDLPATVGVDGATWTALHTAFPSAPTDTPSSRSFPSSFPHPSTQRRPGDLVFWGRDFHHMALYLGGDRRIEAVRSAVRIASLCGRTERHVPWSPAPSPATAPSDHSTGARCVRPTGTGRALG